MEKHPRIGLLQTSSPGCWPSAAYPAPAAWAAPQRAGAQRRTWKFYCAHNAIIRTGAFRRHRMLPVETESYETNPPTLLDFLRREHRWYQCIMKYWFLLKEPGLQSVSHFQVCQILASYLGPASGFLWMLIGIVAESSPGLAAATDG
ncbi:hypothetical protein MGU_05366 [Metarhizium guizhouense ARSEF 977]|uniref:Uncharacterized protein n=1 Tax=Metarhizium guizhouense (strain ARSEF 977) TaxID=1276136 RepID=A0A0B4H6T5_METGA|nr:hypothetical protein MGU_05366 [Metarhizium guizhouense ARSEF 977]